MQLKSLAFTLSLLASPALAQSSYTFNTTAGQDAGIAYAMRQPNACGATTDPDTGVVTPPASAQVYLSCLLTAAVGDYTKRLLASAFDTLPDAQKTQVQAAIAAARAGNPAALQALATGLNGK